MTGRTNAGGGKLFAAIGVTYPAGSVCTCTNGRKTMTAKNTNGQWVFSVPEIGTWTVSCTDGTSTVSETVQISSEGQNVNLELSYRVDLIKAGKILIPFTYDTNTSLTEDDGYARFSIYGNYAETLTSTNKYDLSKYKTLGLTTAGGYAHYSSGKTAVLCIGANRPDYTNSSSSSSLTNVDAYTSINTVEGTFASGDFQLDISALNMSCYVGIALSSTSAQNGRIDIVDLWLE